jgi:hypothetical protein
MAGYSPDNKQGRNNENNDIQDLLVNWGNKLLEQVED